MSPFLTASRIQVLVRGKKKKKISEQIFSSCKPFKSSCLLKRITRRHALTDHPKWYYHNSFDCNCLLIWYMPISLGVGGGGGGRRERWENINGQLSWRAAIVQGYCKDVFTPLSSLTDPGKVTWHYISALWVTGQRWVFVQGQRAWGWMGGGEGW